MAISSRPCANPNILGCTSSDRRFGGKVWLRETPRCGGETAEDFDAVNNSQAWQSKNERNREATFGDAPDLGLRNHRFQNVALRFKKESFYERKTRVFTK
jgi:hypothetical protein